MGSLLPLSLPLAKCADFARLICVLRRRMFLRGEKGRAMLFQWLESAIWWDDGVAAEDGAPRTHLTVQG